MFNNPLFDMFWTGGINQFGNPFNLEKTLKTLGEYEPLYNEVKEFVKGDYKTTVICKFDKNGLLISHSAHCEPITSSILTTLKEQLGDAIEKEDFEKAAEIQKKINKIREQKPTL